MARQKNQSYKKTQSYKEIQADWRWIRSMDPKAAAEALQWMNEHPNERKELERILYYSEADFKKKFSSEELELAEKKAPISYNPEAFLPEEVRNAIYDDMRWFNRATTSLNLKVLFSQCLTQEQTFLLKLLKKLREVLDIMCIKALYLETYALARHQATACL